MQIVSLKGGINAYLHWLEASRSGPVSRQLLPYWCEPLDSSAVSLCWTVRKDNCQLNNTETKPKTQSSKLKTSNLHVFMIASAAGTSRLTGLSLKEVTNRQVRSKFSANASLAARARTFL